ncbi:MAG: hypothetical protein KGR26_02815 [Cyanobacteria bacterium REEB65]|nr:hypothetical protein [Cyanobacteria bacterium REEB65]
MTAVDDREKMIRDALRELEPDEDQWRHFGIMVIPSQACAELAVREFLKRSPRPFPIPLEALSFTVRYVAGAKVVFVDLRRVDALKTSVDELFGTQGTPTWPNGFFRS